MGGAGSTDIACKELCKTAIRGSEGPKDYEQLFAEAFDVWDNNGDGVLSVDELRSVAEALNIKVPEKLLKQVFKEADANKNGSIDRGELASWLFRAPYIEQYFEAMARLYSELAEAAEKKCHAGGDDLALKTAACNELYDKFAKDSKKLLTPFIKKTFQWHDKNGNGLLDQDESIVFFSNYVERSAKYIQQQVEMCLTLELCCDLQIFSNMNEVFLAKRQAPLILELFHKDAGKMYQSAFRCLDTNLDRMLSENEVIEALLPTTNKHREFMRCMGFHSPTSARMEEYFVALVGVFEGIMKTFEEVKFAKPKSKDEASLLDLDCHAMVADINRDVSELRPLIAKAFEYHDADQNGRLDEAESVLFFSYYAKCGINYFKMQVDLCRLLTSPQFADTSEPIQKSLQLFMSGDQARAFRSDYPWLMAAYKKDAENRHRAAFGSLDINGDGCLCKDEVLSAMLPGTREHRNFMGALGLLPPVIEAAPSKVR